MSDNNPTKTEPQVIDGDAARPLTREEEQKQKAFEAYSNTKGKDIASMNIKVYSPSNVYFDGPAFSITAANDTGEFDILPGHHSFICLLNPCDMVVRSVNEGNRKISISGGLMHVKADKIIVFLDI